VNWLLMVVTIALTVGFGKSDNLAVAYGIAVSATMLMTSFLLLIAMREIWQLSLPASVGIAGIPPRLLAQLKEHGCTIDLVDVTYYVGQERAGSANLHGRAYSANSRG
jgi:K+ potassium transporter